MTRNMPTVTSSYNAELGRVAIRVTPADPSYHQVEIWRCSRIRREGSQLFNRRYWGLVHESELHPFSVFYDRGAPANDEVEYQVYFGRLAAREFGKSITVKT
jgi:hypothetical protein